MSRRTSVLLATIALIASGLAVVAASTASPAAAVAEPVVPYCSAPAAPPCLVSFSHDGTAVTGTDYRVVWNEKDPAHGFYNWFYEKSISSSWSAALGDDEIGHTYSVVFNFGDFNPRTLGGLGSPATSTPAQWWVSSGDHFIKINSSPIYRVSDCYYPTGSDTPTCPYTAGPLDETHGWLSQVVNNATWFGSTETEHQVISGFYNLRNTDIGEAPPLQTTDPVTGVPTLVFTLMNAHEDAEHTTFHGAQSLRLPNAMLRDVYGIPDPDTMTSGSLATTISGGVGTITIHPEAGHDAMLVDLTNVTFSTRKVRVKLGTIVPTAPSHLKSWRISSTKGRIYFVKSYPRGARVTGYSARCANGSTIKTATGTSAGVTFTNLGPGKPYACRVRARSKAGYGPWSAVVRFASTP